MIQGSDVTNDRDRVRHAGDHDGGDNVLYGPYDSPMIPHNPHIKYYEGDRRGYFRATVTPKRLRVDLRFVSSVWDRDAVGHTQASWVVEDGHPGAQEGYTSPNAIARSPNREIARGQISGPAQLA